MACNVTAKSGQSKGLEDALGASVKGKLQGSLNCKLFHDYYLEYYSNFIFIQVSFKCFYLSEVESDLPENLRDEAVLCFEAAVANKMQIGDAITKVQKDVLSKCDDVFKGQRFKGFIKFDYETNVVTINVSNINIINV